MSTTYVDYTEAILSPGDVRIDLTDKQLTLDDQVSLPGEPDVASPPDPSADGTLYPPAEQIVDLDHNIWTILEPGKRLRLNGEILPRGTNQSPADIVYYIAVSEGQIYVQKLDQIPLWYRWVGTGNFVLYGPSPPPGVTLDPVVPGDPIPGVIAGLSPALKVARDSVLSGNYVYVATDVFGLSVVNITTPSAPVVIGASPIPFDGGRILLSGSKVYITGTRRYYSPEGALLTVNCFHIIDITIPSSPVVTGSLEGGAVAYFGMVKSGNYIYVACGSDGVKVINVTTPSAPSIVGTYNTAGFANSIAISGSNIYVADGTNGVVVLSISDPVNPAPVTTKDTPGNAKEIAISGTVAYVADSSSVQVLDITNPASLGDLGSYSGTAFGVFVQGSSAYVAAGGVGLVILNITTPGSPTVRGTLPPSGGPGATTLFVSVGINIASVSNGAAGIGIANLTSLTSPVYHATLSEYFSGYKLDIRTGLAVVCGTRVWNGGLNNSYGIRLYNITNPAIPVLLGSLLTTDFAFFGVAFYGNYVFAACGSTGLKIINISNTSNPVISGSYPGIGNAIALAVSGNFLYVACGTQGLKVFDITVPLSPVQIGVLDTPNNAKDVRVVGTVAYVADNTSVQIINISNPQNPQPITSYTTSALDVAVANGVACVAALSIGMRLLDVSVSTNPTLLGFIPPIGAVNPTCTSVDISGTRAFMGNGAGGIQVVDISAPLAPTTIVPVLMLGGTNGIRYASNWVYVTDSLGSLITVAIEEA